MLPVAHHGGEIDHDSRATTNAVSGDVVGPSVQAQVIQGGIHIHQRELGSIPRQLPPAPPHFTNRTWELAALDGARGGGADGDSDVPGAPGLALLVGPGGVGKTALAVSWATRNADLYPDGHLYADLRGFSSTAAVDPEEVIGQFLRGLGVPSERVPVTLAEQAALFRSVTMGRRLLVLLDNALSAAQVRPLLPASAGSTVLVTSRLRLGAMHAEGAVMVEIDPLPREHAVTLLTRSLGASRVTGQYDQVDALVALCGRLPIALRVVAARLAMRPRWNVDRLVDELSGERDRLSNLTAGPDISVRAAFDLSYEALDDQVARLYRLTSVHPGPEFTIEIAAAAADMPTADTEVGLQALVDASLLEELDDDRYRFHDLLRLHGRARAEEVDHEQFDALRRIAEWFLHRMTRANMVVIPDRWRVSQVSAKYLEAPPAFGSGKDAVAWLDGQLPNVLAVLDDVAERGQDELAWQMCEALWELFLHRKHYRAWLSSHEIGVAAARRCGAAEAESRLRCQLGRAYLDLREFDAAERECRLALDLAKLVGSSRNESVALNQLGMTDQGRGDLDSAIAYFRRSLRIEEALGITRGVAIRHRRIGEALLRSGRNSEAAVDLERARALFAAVSDPKHEAKVAISLARIKAKEGRYTAAVRDLEDASAVLEASGSASYHAEVLLAFADISEDNDDVAATRRYLVRALTLLDESGGPLVDQVRSRLAGIDASEEHRSQVAQPASVQQP